MRDDDSLDKSEEGNKGWLSWRSFGTIKMGVLTEEAEERNWCQKAFKVKTAAYNYWNMSVMQSVFAVMCRFFKLYLSFVLGCITFNAVLTAFKWVKWATAPFKLHISTKNPFHAKSVNCNTYLWFLIVSHDFYQVLCFLFLDQCVFVLYLLGRSFNLK